MYDYPSLGLKIGTPFTQYPVAPSPILVLVAEVAGVGVIVIVTVLSIYLASFGLFQGPILIKKFEI